MPTCLGRCEIEKGGRFLRLVWCENNKSRFRENSHIFCQVVSIHWREKTDTRPFFIPNSLTLNRSPHHICSHRLNGDLRLPDCLFSSSPLCQKWNHFPCPHKWKCVPQQPHTLHKYYDRCAESEISLITICQGMAWWYFSSLSGVLNSAMLALKLPEAQAHLVTLWHLSTKCIF